MLLHHPPAFPRSAKCRVPPVGSDGLPRQRSLSGILPRYTRAREQKGWSRNGNCGKLAQTDGQYVGNIVNLFVFHSRGKHVVTDRRRWNVPLFRFIGSLRQGPTVCSFRSIASLFNAQSRRSALGLALQNGNSCVTRTLGGGWAGKSTGGGKKRRKKKGRWRRKGRPPSFHPFRGAEGFSLPRQSRSRADRP